MKSIHLLTIGFMSALPLTVHGSIFDKIKKAAEESYNYNKNIVNDTGKEFTKLINTKSQKHSWGQYIINTPAPLTIKTFTTKSNCEKMTNTHQSNIAIGGKIGSRNIIFIQYFHGSGCMATTDIKYGENSNKHLATLTFKADSDTCSLSAKNHGGQYKLSPSGKSSLNCSSINIVHYNIDEN